MVAPFNKSPLNTAFNASALLLLLIFSPFILNGTGIQRDFASVNKVDCLHYCQAEPDNVELTAVSEQPPHFEGLRSPRTNFALQNTFFNTRWALTPVLNRHIALFIHRTPDLPPDSQSSHNAKYLILDLPPPISPAG